MNINEIDWADSQIKKIIVEYDNCNILIETDSTLIETDSTNSKTSNYIITCSLLVGLTDLCICDDNILDDILVSDANPAMDDYLKNVFKHYDPNFDYELGGGRLLNNIIILSLNIINGIPAKIYCKKITVSPVID